MKYAVLAVMAAIFVAGCASAPVDTGQQAAPVDTGGTAPTGTNQPSATFCGGLTIDLTSPVNNEPISGGFRAVWTIKNTGGTSYTNRDESFTIYMKPDGGAATDLKSLSGTYGEAFNQDITFLQAVPKGNYIVGVRGSMSDCTIPAVEVPVRVV